MRIFVTLNEKGGVGKTTLCCYLAWHFSEMGLRVLAIDLDQQANLSHTLGDPEATAAAPALFTADTTITANGALTVVKSDAEMLELEQGRDEDVPLAFRANVLAASDDFDLCIIDTPPSLGVRALAALLVANYSASPIGLGDYSILGIQRVLDFQDRVAAHFATLGVETRPQFLGMLPSIYDSHSPREKAIFDQLTAAGADIPLLRNSEGSPLVIRKRDAYARSSSERMPAWQMPGTASRAAAAEVRKVMGEFAKKMGLT